MKNYFLKALFIIPIAVFRLMPSAAQTIVFTDSLTRKPVPNALIAMDSSRVYLLTDSLGAIYPGRKKANFRVDVPGYVSFRYNWTFMHKTDTVLLKPIPQDRSGEKGHVKTGRVVKAGKCRGWSGLTIRTQWHDLELLSPLWVSRDMLVDTLYFDLSVFGARLILVPVIYENRNGVPGRQILPVNLPVYIAKGSPNPVAVGIPRKWILKKGKYFLGVRLKYAGGDRVDLIGVGMCESKTGPRALICFLGMDCESIGHKRKRFKHFNFYIKGHVLTK